VECITYSRIPASYAFVNQAGSVIAAVVSTTFTEEPETGGVRLVGCIFASWTLKQTILLGLAGPAGMGQAWRGKAA
jgi:hypothetical protein